MHTDINKQTFVILGGGITGLVIAYILGSKGHKIKIIEASKEIGGLLNTFEIGGTRLETFYHHFFTHDAEMLWLIKELGIEDKLVFHKTTMGIYYDDKIHNFNSPVDALKLEGLNILDKIRFGITSLYLGLVANWVRNEDTSILNWLYKYAGKKVTDVIWAPLLKVKFGSFYKDIPVSWMVGRLSQRLKSRKKGVEKLGYIDGSLKVLLDALSTKLTEFGVEIKTNSPITKLTSANNKITGIVTNSEVITISNTDKVISTIPTNVLSKLLDTVDNEYASKLAKIKYFGAKCVILETTTKLNDIYWLNVAEEGFDFGGVIQQTNLIDPSNYQGHYITYLSRYFSFDEEIANLNKEEVLKLMIPQLQKIFPTFETKNIVNSYVFTTNTAATVCDLNFSGKVPNCKSPISNLFVCSMPHIYPDERSCNNSIRIAANCCTTMGIYTSYIPVNNSLSGLIGFDIEVNDKQFKN